MLIIIGGCWKQACIIVFYWHIKGIITLVNSLNLITQGLLASQLYLYAFGVSDVEGESYVYVYVWNVNDSTFWAFGKFSLLIMKILEGKISTVLSC